MKRRILFVTGTRADFSKLKTLIAITSESPKFDVHIFATGMHLNSLYGRTVHEIKKSGFKNIHEFANHTGPEPVEILLANTVVGLSEAVKKISPDLIVVHGDRVEALAGAIVGSLNNILTAHIEGGEKSGTIDELIRHSISKLCHLHFVANKEARQRLLQMGENHNSIFIIGSPDVDVMLSKNLPTIEQVKKRYNIPFPNYAILAYHPNVTEIKKIKHQAKKLVDGIIESKLNYVVIYPNNDPGGQQILDEYKRLKRRRNIKIFPSLRFEYFLTLLKNSQFIIGNSSAGVREACYYKVPSINIGNRQQNRVRNFKSLLNCKEDKVEILQAIEKAINLEIKRSFKPFGDGKSDKNFIRVLNQESVWQFSQKQFNDLKIK